MYKALRNMSKEEKDLAKWKERGKPKFFWDSHEKGTYNVGRKKEKRIKLEVKKAKIRIRKMKREKDE